MTRALSYVRGVFRAVAWLLGIEAALLYLQIRIREIRVTRGNRKS
jgi:hypothetical protein